MSQSRTQIAEGVRRYALDHYEEGGWDVIVECWSNDDILDYVGAVRTVNGAVKKLKSGVVSVYADYEADAINSAF